MLYQALRAELADDPNNARLHEALSGVLWKLEVAGGGSSEAALQPLLRALELEPLNTRLVS